MMPCRQRDETGQYCDLELGHEGPHAGCRRTGHGPTCEGSALHVRARCATGCPQFQDGSWMARPFCVRMGTPHPPLPGHDLPEYGEAEAVAAWIGAALSGLDR